MNVPVVLLGIDWSELRNQKATLLAVIDGMMTDVSNDKDCNAQITAERDDLQGILNLIDSLQDYAVDEMGIQAIHVLDFEAEEKREAETPEELFARENATIIFQMRIEGEGLYENDDMSKEFIESIVDDSMHASAIKNKIRLRILENVTDLPDEFQRDENGKFTYDSTMMDYGFEIEEYCREIYFAGKTKEVWLCSVCGSDELESHALVNPNAPTENPELINLNDSSSNYCFDCEKHVCVEKRTIPFLAKNAKEIGTTDGHVSKR